MIAALFSSRTAAEILAGILLFVGYTAWERHQGAAGCHAADAAAVASQEAHNAVIAQSQAQTIAQVSKAYEDALLQPVAAPVVRLCLPSGPVPQTPAPAPGHHAAPSLPGRPQPDYLPGPDIGQPLYALAQRADSQVKALQAYIREVCQ